MTKRKSEKTGKSVASKAGLLMKEIDHQLGVLGLIRVYLDGVSETLKLAKSVAASALTQAPDKGK